MKSKLFIFVVAILFVACAKNENEVSDPFAKTNPEELYAKTEYNLDMRDFAMAVSKSLSASPEFRKIIKNEAKLKFDGDYDVVIKRVMNKPVVVPASLSGSSASRVKGSDFSVGDLLGEFMPKVSKGNAVDNSMKKVSASSENIIAELTEKYPNLQVAIPVNIENWDEVNDVPTVTFIPAEADDGVTKALTGYKADGTLVEIDAINEPETEPIIVIGENERIPLDPIDEEVESPTPNNLTATTIETGVALTWVKSILANLTNTKGYNIYRKSSNTTEYSLVGTVTGINNVSFFDNGVLFGTTYSYYITSYNYFSESEPTNQVIITTSTLQSPKNVNAMTGNLPNSIDLQWDGASIGNSYEIIRRKQGDTDFITIRIIEGLHNNFYTDSNLEAGKVYDYKVRTINNNGGFSSWSNTISIHSSNRTRGEQLRIKQFKFTDKGQVEPWWRGAAEILVKAVGSVAAEQINFSYQPAVWEDDIPRNTWFSCEDLPIVISSWDPNSYGAGIKFQWYEQDSGNVINFGLDANYENKKNGAGWGVGGKFNYTANDENDFMGEFTVAWWDLKGIIYSTNVIDIEFY